MQGDFCKLVRIVTVSLFVIVALSVVDVGLLQAQQPLDVPTIRAGRLQESERLVLDGRLDEQFWTRTQVADSFLQQDPIEGGQPTENTEVRVVYDADNLYIGAVMHDTDPTGILGHQRQRHRIQNHHDGQCRRANGRRHVGQTRW